MVDQVNEKSTCWITIAFKDKDGNAATPSAIHYRIDDAQTGTNIIPETQVGGVASLELEVAASKNAIINDRRSLERHRLTVRAVFGADDEHNAQYEFDIVNLQFKS